MNIKTYLTVFCGIVLINFCSCRDDFSSRRAGFDYIRIPFIRPYEALRLNGSTKWQMNLYNSALNSSIVNIKEVYVKNDAILLYSENTNLDGRKVNKAWFVVIPSKHVERGFSNEDDYTKHLYNIGITKKPSLININRVSNYFDVHYPINWAELH